MLGRMPRVSESHQERQAARILAAARACFARRGFHAASMDEIVAEAAMSSSTVYRYFPEGKKALVKAVIEGWFRPVVEWLESLDGQRIVTLEDLFAQAVERVFAAKDLGADESVGLVMDISAVWARDPELRRISVGHYRRMREGIRVLVERLQADGQITTRLPAAEIAALLHHLAMGLVNGRAVGETVDARATGVAVARLLAP